MLKLLAKTTAVNTHVKELLECHTYWIWQFPITAQLLVAILDYGVCKVSIHHPWLIVSGTTEHWHELAGCLLEDELLNIRKFATTLVMSNNELFGKLSRTLKPDGTIVLRK